MALCLPVVKLSVRQLFNRSVRRAIFLVQFLINGGDNNIIRKMLVLQLCVLLQPRIVWEKSGWYFSYHSSCSFCLRQAAAVINGHLVLHRVRVWLRCVLNLIEQAGYDWELWRALWFLIVICAPDGLADALWDFFWCVFAFVHLRVALFLREFTSDSMACLWARQRLFWIVQGRCGHIYFLRLWTRDFLLGQVDFGCCGWDLVIWICAVSKRLAEVFWTAKVTGRGFQIASKYQATIVCGVL